MLRVAVALIALCAIARAQGSPPPAGTITKPPKLIQAMAPEYPPAALTAGKTAKVKVRLTIDATGVVTKVDVLERVGDGFDEAAVAAAMQYVFEPAEIDGKPAQVSVETTIGFTIEQRIEEEPPPPAPKQQEAAGPPNHGGS